MFSNVCIVPCVCKCNGIVLCVCKFPSCRVSCRKSRLSVYLVLIIVKFGSVQLTIFMGPDLSLFSLFPFSFPSDLICNFVCI